MTYKQAPIAVIYKDHMGDDNSVVNAARVSFAKDASNFTPEQNKNLIKYLAKHNHWTPFAHAFVTLHMKALLLFTPSALSIRLALQ